jgi:hypothetical protein
MPGGVAGAQLNLAAPYADYKTDRCALHLNLLVKKTTWWSPLFHSLIVF